MSTRPSEGLGRERPRSAGFTLIEVLVATGLVGIVAHAIAPLMLVAVQTSAGGSRGSSKFIATSSS